MRKTALIPQNQCSEYWSQHDDELLMRGFIEAEIHIRLALLAAEQSSDDKPASDRADS